MHYEIKFGDTIKVVTEAQLQNFIDVAVIKNKDISCFEVTRIKDLAEYEKIQRDRSHC